MEVRTRFAPSPTGMLHIGGARTALFNYLYARNMGGKYLLRIEDTDPERSTQGNVDIINEALAWLGMASDEDTVMQTNNIEKHKAAVAKLLENGNAYECFCSKEELATMREEQQANKQTPRYDGRHRDLTDEQKAAFIAEGRKPVVRIKVPTEGVTAWEDLVQGKIEVPNHTLDDFIIMRSDGTPTYNLVVALDDHDMGISHVIRGDDHINNTPKQIAVFKAMGYGLPKFAHLPMIHGKNGKMSKRDGATNVLAYRDEGYLPEALNNYLMRLGWSLGDEEIISMAKAIDNFDINDVNKGASKFDQQKLDWVNGEYIKTASNNELVDLLEHHFDKLNLKLTDEAKKYLTKGLDDLKPKAKKLTDLANAASFYLNKPPFILDEKSANAMTDEAKDILGKIVVTIESINDWNHDAIGEELSSFCEANELKFKQIGMPLRVALCGTTKAPGVGQVMEAFGKDESLARVKASL